MESSVDAITMMMPNIVTELKDSAIQSLSYNHLIDFILSKEMINTIIFLLFTIFFYVMINRYLKKKEGLQTQTTNEEDDKEINKIKIKKIFLRNTFIAFVFIGLFLIWKDEIKTTFLSISFAIMALVVLFKEILMNIFASLVVKTYSIGDIIEFKGKIGRVVDRTLLHTKIILKQDSLNTGRELVVPNSNFLSNEITILTRLGNYSTHFLNVNVDKREDLLECSKLLKNIAEQVTIQNKDRGNKMNNWKKQLKKKEGIDIPSHKPFVVMHPEDKPYMTLKYTCDIRYAFLIQQEIMEKYFEEYIKLKNPISNDSNVEKEKNVEEENKIN